MINWQRSVVAGALVLFIGADTVSAQSQRPPLPGQLTVDFVAGKVPRDEEIVQAEKDVAAHPNDLDMIRRLGKGYFFKFFGGDDASAVAKAKSMFDRALAIAPDDPETVVYYGGLLVYTASRLDANDPAKQKDGYEKGFALLQRAEKIAPRHGAVISVSSASYLELPASYNMVPHVIQNLEGMRKGMGPAWDRFSHHGRQRLLWTLGRAHARAGNADKARTNFEEGLAINTTSVEAELIRAELNRIRD